MIWILYTTTAAKGDSHGRRLHTTAVKYRSIHSLRQAVKLHGCMMIALNVEAFI